MARVPFRASSAQARLWADYWVVDHARGIIRRMLGGARHSCTYTGMARRLVAAGVLVELYRSNETSFFGVPKTLEWRQACNAAAVVFA